ncbi:hypothetical protein [Butyrivibrio sp. YAB3001]|uniref:hypothetical protein n=1 Tax=Butyrivibrio sp. YAB3001 TaxID=1520812 RepID=UPI0008F62632|nr:hypothetical protein [Butyrivibrio sp. YAB3001]SFB67737.1 hypothetical protein SAMN02910398_00151 [Butyrivibrio sp. YAB3001]
MNNFINELERKIGKFAIPNLTIYIIGLYVVGYVLQLAPSSVNITAFLTLNPALILQGQIWRIFSWILIPPSGFSLLIFITLIFYYFIGNTMERTLGTFRYNLFIFGGMIFMIIGAFLAYAIYNVIAPDTAYAIMFYYSSYFSTYYLQQTVFLAFAILYPQMQVLLMFIIPIKVKYLGILYGAIMVYECFVGFISQNYCIFFAIGSQLLNLILFWLQTGKLSHFRPKEVKRRNDFQRGTKMTPKGVTRHKCAVCGRTEVDHPELEFRFCSKCNGNYEYCQDHLFTHQHVK